MREPLFQGQLPRGWSRATRNEQLAWAAGFFDGEGCVTSSDNRSARPMLFITQHDPRVLRRFWKVIGQGKVYGPYRSGWRYKDRNRLPFERLLAKPRLRVPTVRWVWKTNG